MWRTVPLCLLLAGCQIDRTTVRHGVRHGVEYAERNADNGVIEIHGTTSERRKRAEELMAAHFPDGYTVIWEGIEWEHKVTRRPDSSDDVDRKLFPQIPEKKAEKEADNTILSKFVAPADKELLTPDEVVEVRHSIDVNDLHKDVDGETSPHRRQTAPLDEVGLRHRDDCHYYICYRRKRTDLPPDNSNGTDVAPASEIPIKQGKRFIEPEFEPPPILSPESAMLPPVRFNETDDGENPP